MSQYWAERTRATAKLIRRLGGYVLDQKEPSAEQLYGLCKLTWITTDGATVSPGYVISTKIPALADIAGEDYGGRDLPVVARDVARLSDAPDVFALVMQDTAFTNFYKAYRNASREWIEQHHKVLIKLFKDAYALTTDEEGMALIKAIDTLPGIPLPNHSERLMRPQNLLTPVFACLDARLRFPLINGNKGVQKLLSALKIKDAGLVNQYWPLIRLYGTGGIDDFADLDQVGQTDLTGFVGDDPTKQLLALKPVTGATLPLKDETDVLALQEAGERTQRRLHNSMTNRLRELLANFTLFEGRSKAAMYDVLVKKFDGDNDLLIEVKSAIDDAQTRMAIGQLYAYSHKLQMGDVPHLAILFPEKPPTHLRDLLAWLDIGIFWLDPDGLCTTDAWLEGLAMRK